ncbi:hypothetical protein Lal_00047114 [Lupinus albus]|uniref:Uncharacterized protein n=1 Tax=Lupinus albus TaxID=3870 RepID=A0A6A5N7Z5_LUPAL|nr:hypothetical protein Lalb_Chr02g0144041 [Lupinus albus]KAF1878445.1 hypothetical protein Lal_00047114 [Lupinus albus]
MATRTGRLFHDQNLNAHVNGEGVVSGKGGFTGQNKARAGRRKPLGDLSNAGKPINHAGGKKPVDGSLKPGKLSEHLKSSNLTVITNDESNIKTANKASEKSQTGRRKVLGDISNLPVLKNKNSLKVTSLTEDLLFHPSELAEEQFLHNHQKCIKSQFENVMDVHHFFKTVGLENDSDDHKPIAFELSAISKRKVECENLEFKEVPEKLLEVQSPYNTQQGSPTYCKTPKSSHCKMWNHSDVNFKLMETP